MNNEECDKLNARYNELVSAYEMMKSENDAYKKQYLMWNEMLKNLQEYVVDLSKQLGMTGYAENREIYKKEKKQDRRKN